jgi:exodeoxyribonuclease V alpha subunit
MQYLIERYPSWIQSGIESGWIDHYETELLAFIEEEFGELPEEVKYAVIFLSLFIKAGHVSLPLDEPVGYWTELLEVTVPGLNSELNVAIESLLNHKAFGEPDEMVPFLIEGDQLFIRSFLIQEKAVAESLINLSSARFEILDIDRAASIVRGYFEHADSDDINWQKAAAALSVRNRLLILSGGPGTGKTTTVARIIAVLLRSVNDKLWIALAAPTGKAAARMSEALQNSLTDLQLPDELKMKIPSEAQTLHRLMRGFGSDKLLPEAEPKMLPYDLIVVDEASMIDLTMMDKLLRFISEDTRLIILGDKDQLSSVEAGSVFGDICKADGNRFSSETAEFLSNFDFNKNMDVHAKYDLEDSIVYLEKNYRFGDESGISALSEAVNTGNADKADDLITGMEFKEISHNSFNYSKKDIEMLFSSISKALIKSADYDDMTLLNHWSDEVWLSALRSGPFGTDSLNRMIEEYLVRQKLIQPENGWYHGRPILVTRNDYSIGVFNGDLGVSVDRGDGKMEVLFTDYKGHLKRFSPYRIKQFEPAYILTVHKSQGSEFNHVNFLLPDRDTQLLTKELIYTAITRARKSFRLLGSRELFKQGVKRKTVRFTGLQSRLYSSV